MTEIVKDTGRKFKFSHPTDFFQFATDLLPEEAVPGKFISKRGGHEFMGFEFMKDGVHRVIGSWTGEIKSAICTPADFVRRVA